MIHKNIIAFKGPHLHPHLMVSGLEAENVPVALKLRNVNIRKAYCENDFTKKNESFKSSLKWCDKEYWYHDYKLINVLLE